MSTKKPLILMVSESMDSNRKDNRNEKGLVRMSQNTREYMGFDSQVELWPETENPIEGKIKQAVLLQIFHSFKKDVGTIKKLVKNGELSEEDSKRVGFVTKDVYDRVITGSKNKNVWISETIEDVPIGSDPEFMLFDNDDKILYAATVPGFSHYLQLGSDGPLAELRPDPATTSKGLVHNIKKLFNDTEMTDPIKDLKWIGGCYHYDQRSYPIGGHLHFGNPVQINKLSQDDRLRFFRAANKILDELLSVPLIRLDGDMGRKRRVDSVSGRYGWFGEMRVSSGRLEHRTLSGVWLAHPELAIAVIGTAKAIIEEVYRYASDKKFALDYIAHNHLRSSNVFETNFSQWDEIPIVSDLGCIKTSEDMHNILNESDMNYVNVPFIKKWYTKMKSLSTYQQYSSDIDRLYSILKAPEKKILSLNLDIKNGWVLGKEFDI